MDGFQRMVDLEQQSVRVEGQVQRHVPCYGRLGSGQEEVDGGLSGEPGASLKNRMWELLILAPRQTHKCAMIHILQHVMICHTRNTQMPCGAKKESFQRKFVGLHFFLNLWQK